MLRTPVAGRRLDILEWLKEPDLHFPARRGASPERGVTAGALAHKLGVRRRVAGNHLVLLARAGLLRAEKVGLRTYYRRDEMRIAEAARMFEKGWQR
ncbi:helix-turn-helix domain-containing protein [Streptomyces sp. NPDC004539]|uniref:ArsR/SmtB family transcription factor n=1 Tax=Streptomyces sp. NPDC004539 TaxID=3154280 RepID=UPI0033B96519